jgi:hypothetical protein
MTKQNAMTLRLIGARSERGGCWYQTCYRVMQTYVAGRRLYAPLHYSRQRCETSRAKAVHGAFVATITFQIRG